MKKLFALLMALMMVLSAMPVALGEGSSSSACSHQWSQVDWTQPNSCEDPMVGYRFCSLCQQSERVTGSARGHNYVTRTENPSCTGIGKKVTTCTYCNLYKEETIDALGHSWSEWTGDNITCTTGGKQSRTCSRCSANESREVTATGHNMTDWAVSVKAGCKKDGVEERHCTKCSLSETRSIKALGHNYGAWETTKEPTCVSTGMKETHCQRCGLLWDEELPTAGHSWGSWYLVYAATPEAPGREQRDCQICGTPEYRDLPYGAAPAPVIPVTPSESKPEPLPEPEPAPTDTALGLTGSCAVPAEGYMVSDNAYVGLVIKNNEKVPVSGMKLFVTVTDASGAVIVPQAMINYWSGGEIMFYNGTVSYDYMYTVTDTDAAYGPLTLVFQATAMSADNGATVESNTWSVTIPVNDPSNPGEPDGDPTGDETPAVDASLALTVNSNPGVYAEVGASVTVGLKLTNNSGTMLSLAGYAIADASYNPTMPADSATLVDGSAAASFYPGAVLDGSLTLVVTNDDVNKGRIERNVYFGALSVENPSEYVYSNVVTVVIPLILEGTAGEGQPQLVLNVTQMSAAQSTYAEGNVISYAWTLTNIGSAGCTFDSLYVSYGPASDNIMGGYTFADAASVSDAYLAPYSGSISGTGTFDIPGGAGYTDQVSVSFSSTALSAADGAACKSNRVPFTYALGTADGYTGWTAPEDLLPDVTLVKTVTSTPALAAGYVEGEVISFRVDVTNEGPLTIHDLDVIDPLKGTNEDSLLDSLHDFGAGQTVSLTFDYTVTYDDVLRGYVFNQATADWYDYITDTPRTSSSNSVVVPTFGRDQGLAIQKSVISTPANGEYYVEGEQVIYSITLTNPSSITYFDVFVKDPLAEDGYKVIAQMDYFMPGELWMDEFVYTVTALDVEVGSVTNVASFYCSNLYGSLISGISNSVTVPTGLPMDEVTVVKTETSAPANGAYYEAGEVIMYSIVVTNQGDNMISEAVVYDCENYNEPKETGAIELFSPSDSRSYSYFHMVTDEDLARGYATNFAMVIYSGSDDLEHTVFSDIITSPVGAPGIVPPVPNIPTISDGIDPCYRTLDALGDANADYTLHMCEVHQPASAAAQSAMMQEDWTGARAAWETAINTLYDAALRNTQSAETRLAILNEKALFYAQLNAHENLLRGYGMIDMEICVVTCEMMQQHCVDLCYELHTAPAARTDSFSTEHQTLPAAEYVMCSSATVSNTIAELTYGTDLCTEHADAQIAAQNLLRSSDNVNGVWLRAQSLWQVKLDHLTNTMYTNAAPEMKRVIASDRTVFDSWVNARTVFLSMIYTDPAIVSEVVAQTVADRTIDLCELQFR